ncbi:MAG TPA: hypothetical protein VNX68_04775 [Nitrosopumilaceae archaeon]|jgi:hypothetical protein|nr:hypothetical protein [Nitrosopumilaceae archaeon]
MIKRILIIFIAPIITIAVLNAQVVQQSIGYINGSGVANGPILEVNGAVGAPSYSFASTPNTGIFTFGGTSIAEAIGGVTTLFNSSTLQEVPSNLVIGWSSTTAATGALDTGVSRLGANSLALGNGTASNASANLSLGSISLGNLTFSSTAPTVTSGFGTTPGTIVAGSTSTSFRILVGAGAATTTGVIGLPTAVNFWNCDLWDMTTPLDVTRQTASTTSSVTFTATIGWTAGDTLIGRCTGS